jgi:hypothetical protein
MIENEIRYKDQLCARVGLTMTLWLQPNALQAQVWPALLRAAQAFAQSTQGQLQWHSCSLGQEVDWLSTMAMQSSEPDLVTEAADLLAESLRHMDEQPFNTIDLMIEEEQSMLLDIALGSDWLDGQPWREPQSLLFYANLPPAGSDVSGFIRVHLPIGESESDSATTVNAQALESFMRACLQSLPVLHGTAGFGLQLPLNFRFFQANLFHAIALHPAVQSYCGLDVYDPAEQAILFSEKLYTVNWLNYIGDALVNGKALTVPNSTPELTRELLKIERAGSGFLLKAGAHPLLIARNQNLPPEMQALQAAAHLLKPWRATVVPNECIAPAPYGYAQPDNWQQACDDYLRRFDGD